MWLPIIALSVAYFAVDDISIAAFSTCRRWWRGRSAFRLRLLPLPIEHLAQGIERIERLAAEEKALAASALQKAKEAVGRWVQNLGSEGRANPVIDSFKPMGGA